MEAPSSSLLQRFLRWLDLWSTPETSREALFRGRILQLACFAGLFAVSPFIPLHYWFGNYHLAFTIALVLTASFLSIVILRMYQAVVLAATSGIVMAHGLLCFQAFRDSGIDAAVVFYFWFPPVLGHLLGGRRWMYIWALIVCISLVILWAAPRLGFEPHHDVVEYRQLFYLLCAVGSVLLFCGIIYIYDVFLYTSMKSEAIHKIVEEKTKLVKAERAALEAIEAKTNFLAMVGHELRTPLNGVIGLSELLQDDPSLTPQTRKRVEEIHQSGERLLDWVIGILDYTALERPEGGLPESEFHKRWQDLESQAYKLGAKSFLMPAPPKDLLQHPDGAVILRILGLLLGHARALGGRGEISVQTGTLGQALYLEVSLSDSTKVEGGHPQALVSPANEGEGECSIKAGFGIGLALAEGLSRTIDGEITVLVPSPPGLSFRLHIPVREGVTVAEETHLSGSEGLAGPGPALG